MSESIANSEDLNSLSVSTDQLDYSPGSTVNITLTGLAPGASATFQIADLVSDPGDDGDADTYQPFTATDGGEGDLDGVANGVILTSWTVPTTGDPDNATLSLTATSGDRTASTTFTDAVAKDYQHWSDTGTPDWEGNILNDAKSDYFEGEIIPHIYVIENKDLTPGQSYSFTISYNFYQQNTDANGFGFITTYNLDRNATPISGGTGVAPSANGPALPSGGSFYTNNATITNVSAPVTTGTGNLDQTVTVTFTYTGPATNEIAEFYFGLQVAPPGNGNNGASAWTGGSLQTTINSSFSGAVSVQLSPDAIIRGVISGVKFNDLDGDGTQDVGEPGLGGWTIFLDNDDDGNLDVGEVSTITASNGSYSFSVTPDANPADPDNDPYIVREVNQAGWTQTSLNPEPIFITTADPNEANVNFGNQQQVRSLHIEKDADKASVGTVGETITYTMLVTNTGNAAIANVTVDDLTLSDEAPVLVGGFNAGDTDQDDLLDVDETWEFSGTREVTQADLDAGDDLVNTATATGDEADPDDDDATVTVDQSRVLHIEKDADKASVGTVGETITYTMLVTNTGNAAIANVTVDDLTLSDEAPVLVGGFNAGDTDQDDLLDVDETWEFSGTREVTQADLDAGDDLVNTATATGDEADPDDDDATVTVDQSRVLHIEKDADKASVGTVGETITYTMLVTNTGNAAIANVTVDDLTLSDEAPVLVGGFNAGDTDQDDLLDVDETWEFSGTREVTQADLDAGDDLVNTATATGDEADPDDDDATVTVDQSRVLHIEKDADKASVGTVGETITYTMLVTNTGNAAIANVTVDDLTLSDEAPVLVGGFNAGDTDQDDLLDVDETWEFSGTREVTQADLDAGDDLVNTATATGDEADPDDDDATVTVSQSKALHIEKDATVPGGTANIGETISYTLAVTNTGNAAIANVVVDDPFTTNEAPVLSGGFNIGDIDHDDLLDVSETWQYTASHVVTQAEGTAGTNIVNTATVTGDDADPDDDDATVPVAQINFGQITPTGTTVNQYINGTAQDFSDYYASQGGVVQYGVKGSKINSTNPGVFFYYTGLSNSIMSVAGAAISVYIDQSDSNSAVGSFSTTKTDVKLWLVNDLDNNGIDAGDTVTQVKLAANQITLGTGANAGDVTVNYDPASTSNSLYVISVQYTTGSVVGNNVGSNPSNWPTVGYTFTTNVGGGGIEETDPNGITLAPKFSPLTLEGAAGEGAKAVSDAQLDSVVDQAIQYWEEQGVSGKELAGLRHADFVITDLGGTTLAATDGSTIWIDDDAAGQGWSLGQDGVAAGDVDLYSAVVHEYGHLLGYDHDVMGETLAVGERIEPLAAATNDDDLPGSTAIDWLALSELPIGKIAASLNVWHKGIDGPDHGTVIGNSLTPIDALNAIDNALDSYGINFANDGDFQASDTHQTAMQTYLQSLSTSV